MRIETLDTSGSRYEALFSVSGFGSHGVLAPESGLHVFEIPKTKGRFERIRARVQVAPVPTRVLGGRNTISGEATNRLDEAAPDKIEIVRRYREQPSPLARDSVRGWRTGRLDLVLKGNFDLIA